ncbi:MAG: hypothetical protein D6803_08875 [Anaerolineae bacterium]|nr:MAG: hypothetical protein D6803_08875 [Anaerolineae bacterium]
MAFVILDVLVLGYSVLGWGVLESRLLPLNAGVAGVFFIGLVVWRGWLQRALLPKTGAEAAFVAWLAVVALSLVINFTLPGLARLTMWVAYGLVFYLCLDLLDENAAALQMAAALVAVAGMVNLLALAEMYARYSSWMSAWGGHWVWPPEMLRFMSVLGYSGASMALSNLAAPFTVVLYRRARKAVWRVGLVYWWLMYGVAVFGASSRGALVGVVVWIGAYAALWLREHKDEVFRVYGRRKGLLLAGVGVLSAAAVFFGVFLVLSRHSSHGALLSGRDVFWRAALWIWREHLWLGAGPGKFGFEYLRYASVPPQFWATYSHNTLLQVLADEGILGLTAFLGLAFMVARRVWNGWSREGGNRGLQRAALASMGAFAAHSLVDDFTTVPGVMIALMAVAAIGYQRPRALPRFARARLVWLLVPSLEVVGVLAWTAWGYAPLRGALQAAHQGDWQQAARLGAVSAERVPSSAFYQTEAGLLYARWWEESGRDAALQAALRYFEMSTVVEPTVAVNHANLSVLYWNAGQRAAAIQSMRRAVDLAPEEPLFALNLGWFYENLGDEDSARFAYRRALSLSPQWAADPFWAQNEFRRDVVSGFASLAPAKSSSRRDVLIEQAWQSFARGDLEEAERLSLLASWFGGEDPRLLLLQGQIAERRGDRDEAARLFARRAEVLAERRYVLDYNFIWLYTVGVHRREGVHFDLVPGFLRVEADCAEIVGRTVCEARQR